VLCSSATRRSNAVKSCSFKIFGYLEKRELTTESLLHVTAPLAYNTEVPKLQDLQNIVKMYCDIMAERENSGAKRDGNC
jgi:hypothetical protein